MRLRSAVLLALAALALPGCLLTRLLTVRDQLCAFDKYFSVVPCDSIRIRLLEPVLLADDITWLAGADGLRRSESGGALVVGYDARKRGDDTSRACDLHADFVFTETVGQYRFSELRAGRTVAALVPGQLLIQIVRSLCAAEKNLVGRTATIDLHTIDRSLLLPRSELLAVLGPPNRQCRSVDESAYEYEVTRSDSTKKAAVVHILFGAGSDRIERITITYSRYRLDADLGTGKAVLTVMLSGKGEAAGGQQ